MKKLAVRATIIFLALAVVAFAAEALYRARAVSQMFGGDAALDTVAHASRVEAFRLGPLPADVQWQDAAREDYPVTSGPVDVPAPAAAEIAAALISKDSYRWHSIKLCMPNYGVRLSFYREADRVDVFLCFECDILGIAHNGRATGGEDFDDVRPVFVRASKKLFPDDPEIQGLDAH